MYSLARQKQMLKRRQRRGVSSVVGGIFVLVVIVLGVTSLILITNMQDKLDQAQNSAAQLDILRNQEQLSLSNAQFGGSQIYSASQSYVTDSGANAGDGCKSGNTQICGLTMTSGSGFRYDNAWWCAKASVCNSGNANGGVYTLGTVEPAYLPFNVTSTSTSSPTSGSQEGISNMNITNSAAGWTFYTTGTQVIGGYDPIEGNGIPGSGVGSLFFGATYVRGSSVNGNLSTRFYVDPTSTGVGSITSTLLSYAYFMPAANEFATCLVPTNGVDFSIYLVDQTTGFKNSGNNYLITTVTDNGDQNWNYLRGGSALATLANGSAISNVLIDKGYYSLVIDSTVNFKSAACTSAAARFYGYYDDIGLSYTYSSLVSDWYYTFVAQQAPLSVRTLSFGVTSFSNVTGVLQYVYLYDWVLNAWDLFSTSTISTSPSTVSITVNVTNTGQYSAQNLVSPSGGLVELRVYSIHPITGLPLGAHEMETDISAVSQTGSNGFSVGVSYTSNSAFTVSVTNGGPQPLTIVMLGIVDGNGHTYINSSGILFYNGTFKTTITYNPVLNPLQTVTTNIGYTWTSGSMKLEFVTSRGNVFVFSETAS